MFWFHAHLHMVRCRHDLYKYHGGELRCLTKPIWREGEGTRNNVKDGNKYCFSSCPFSRWRCRGSLEGFPRLLFLTLLWAVHQILASDFIYAEKRRNKNHRLDSRTFRTSLRNMSQQWPLPTILWSRMGHGRTSSYSHLSSAWRDSEETD